MNRLDEMTAKLREAMPVLREKYKVESLQAFGSYVRGEQNKESDLDILVEFYDTIDLFAFMELESFLSEVLDIKVDLVMKDTLKSRIKDRILEEAISI